MVASHFYLQDKSQDSLNVDVNETLRRIYTHMGGNDVY